MPTEYIDYIAGIAGTGSQPYQVLDPFLNNQGARGHSFSGLRLTRESSNLYICASAV
jgi:hypothetical protein